LDLPRRRREPRAKVSRG